MEGRAGFALQIVDARLASERAANPDSELGVPRLSLIRADALTTLERYDEAEQTLDSARDAATAQGARPVLWRIELAVGHVHRLQRRRLEARRAFDAARAMADALAATVPDDGWRARFLEASWTRRIPVVAGANGGSRREGSVRWAHAARAGRGALVAQGKANRAIGRDLGIGERTVEGYVASALAKLGLRVAYPARRLGG